MHVPTSMLAANAAADPDSKQAEAYRFVRERIVSLELAPASLLDEQALADAIGVGLTPVRQALRRLAWESLVIILPRRGTMVAASSSRSAPPGVACESPAFPRHTSSRTTLTATPQEPRLAPWP